MATTTPYGGRDVRHAVLSTAHQHEMINTTIYRTSTTLLRCTAAARKLHLSLPTPFSIHEVLYILNPTDRPTDPFQDVKCAHAGSARQAQG